MSVNILNVFQQDAFNTVSLTNAVNDVTPTYGRLGALGLFVDEGVNNRTVAVDFDPVTNSLIPQSAWGGPGVANKTALGKTKSYNLPHFPIHDQILAADLQSRRRPGSDAVQDAQYALGKKMKEMRVKLEQTQEWMRLGVLKSGQVKDGAGNLILDIYNDFGISQTSTSFALGTGTTDIMGKIAGVKRNIITALRGELLTGFIGLCSDGFYDAFVSHANVKAAFQYYQANGQNLATDYSGGSAPASNVRGFIFGGSDIPTVWINYTGTVTDSNGSAQTLIDSNSAYLFPMGTSVFKMFYAPADYMETINTEGLPFYAKQRLLEYDKGIEVECQSNPLPICLKPAVIQKLTT
jgi:hypothetical protein